MESNVSCLAPRPRRRYRFVSLQAITAAGLFTRNTHSLRTRRTRERSRRHTEFMSTSTDVKETRIRRSGIRHTKRQKHSRFRRRKWVAHKHIEARRAEPPSRFRYRNFRLWQFATSKRPPGLPRPVCSIDCAFVLLIRVRRGLPGLFRN